MQLNSEPRFESPGSTEQSQRLSIDLKQIQQDASSQHLL